MAATPDAQPSPISFRVTDAERARIERHAHAAGLSFSAYVRAAALDRGDSTTATTPALDTRAASPDIIAIRATVTDLRRALVIAAAKHAHTNARSSDPSCLSVLQQIQAELDRLSDQLGG